MRSSASAGKAWSSRPTGWIGASTSCARLVRAEERAALRRHLGAGFAPVQGLRRIPGAADALRRAQATAANCRWPSTTDCDAFLRERLAVLEQQLTTVNSWPQADALPDAIITSTGRLEDHAARPTRCPMRPQRSDAASVRPAAAPQDHRIAAGGRSTGPASPGTSRTSRAARRPKDQHAAADRHPGRRDQPWA